MKNNKAFLIGGAAILIGLVGWVVFSNRGPGELDAFAQCLGEKGAVFYGAFWCPNCKDQKEMFGKSQRRLPYVECSTPDGNSQKQECREKNIVAYPTWEFADGERQEGVTPLGRLAEKTGCSLP